LSVYLKDQRVRHLDWTGETSNQIIRRQYYFEGPAPRLVAETVHGKFDSRAEPLSRPRLLSTKRYRLDRLDDSRADNRQKELRDHAKFLVDDFYKHRKQFARTSAERMQALGAK
jgi:hypothetical protein